MDEYPAKVLIEFDHIQDDLIITLFDCRDKRDAIRRALKAAYRVGYNQGARRRHGK